MHVESTLARQRAREDQRTARERRVAARLVAARRWRRLSAFAADRAARATRGR